MDTIRVFENLDQVPEKIHKSAEDWYADEYSSYEEVLESLKGTKADTEKNRKMIQSLIDKDKPEKRIKVSANTKRKDELLKVAVAGLRNFGYPECNEVNIFTDAIYSRFFVKQIQTTLSSGLCTELDRECLTSLLNQIKSDTIQ
jgi:hypothetical protein